MCAMFLQFTPQAFDVIEPAEPVAPPASFFKWEDWVGMVIRRIGEEVSGLTTSANQSF